MVDYSPCIWTWGQKAPENKVRYTCFRKEEVPVCIQGHRQKCLLCYLRMMIIAGEVLTHTLWHFHILKCLHTLLRKPSPTLLRSSSMQNSNNGEGVGEWAYKCRLTGPPLQRRHWLPRCQNEHHLVLDFIPFAFDTTKTRRSVLLVQGQRPEDDSWRTRLHRWGTRLQRPPSSGRRNAPG